MAQAVLFPVTVVGSWPRPPWLIHALRKRQAGDISDAEFQEVADRAVRLALQYQEDAGVDIVTDGEQRRDNFYSFVVEKLSGMRLMKVSELLDYVKDRARSEEAHHPPNQNSSSGALPAHPVKLVCGPFRPGLPRAG